MHTLRYDPSALDERLRAALELLSADEPWLSPSSGAIALDAAIDPARAGESSFTWDGRTLAVRGGSVPQVLRALSAWRGMAASGQIPASHSQSTPFGSIGLMFDASRNAVPTVATVKLMLRKMALLGMNQFMLYTEDTYEVPGQPLIGYLRGRYSQAELKEIDDYAAALGIEVIPCIQALAHLAQMLRWPAFAEVRDTEDILLADEPRTYALLEQMIDAATAPLRTKRIHLGMDEAHQIGLGRYRQRHGIRPRFEILSAHLAKVSEICRRRGLRPMIWSDMYFRLASATGDYYSEDARIPPEVASQIPEDLQLVYWDYYHWDVNFYRDWMTRHQAAQRDVLFAGGVWTWSRFWLELGFTRITTEPALRAARETGVREVFATAWGDDGAEADFLSLLQGLTYFAAVAWSPEPPDEAELRRQFRGACDGDWDAWRLNEQLDTVPGLPTIRELSGGNDPGDVPAEWVDSAAVNWAAANPSKGLLWQDPLLGLVDGNLSPELGRALSAHYRALADRLESTADDGWGRSAYPLAIARVLADKADLGLRLHAAYQQRDRRALEELAERILPRVLANCQALHETHKRLWMKQYKPFGWEVIDCRYGGLEARLRTTQQRLRAWLAGEIDSIEELEAPRLPVMPWPKDRLGYSPTYRRLISPSVIV